MSSAREAQLRKGDPIPGTAYVFEAVIGAGGHGTVIRAKHAFLDKPVVIKLLHAELGTDEDLVRRSLREAKILAKMEHPNIVGVTDGGMTAEDPPRPFFVMDALQGIVLYDALKSAPSGLGFATTVSLVLGVLDGLDFAHTEHKVIHRDIKPSNIFIHRTASDTTVPKLLDFGIAHVQQAHRHTGKGFLGTPRYAAPEQILGEKPTARTDLYAVGLVLYECLLGRGPFAEVSDYPAVLAAQLNTKPVRLSQRMDGVPPAIDEIVMCLLEKDPARRPESAAATAVMLRLVKGHLDKQLEPRIQAPEFRTEPTPLDNTLLTTRGEPASTPNLVANDTVPGAPPFTDVILDDAERDPRHLSHEPTEESPVDLGRTPIDRHARTRSHRDGTPVLPRHGTTRLRDLASPSAREATPAPRAPVDVSRRVEAEATETPLSSSATVTRERHRRPNSSVRHALLGSSVAPWILVALTLATAVVVLLRFGRHPPRSENALTTSTLAEPGPSMSPARSSASLMAPAKSTPAPPPATTTAATMPSAAHAAPLAVTPDAGVAPPSSQPSTSTPSRPRDPRGPQVRRSGLPSDPSSVGFE